MIPMKPFLARSAECVPTLNSNPAIKDLFCMRATDERKYLIYYIIKLRLEIYYLLISYLLFYNIKLSVSNSYLTLHLIGRIIQSHKHKSPSYWSDKYF